MEIWQALTPLISLIIIPVINSRINRMEKRDSAFHKERLEIEEADMKMNKYSRLLTRQTAQAVKDGRSNGELSKAIRLFDEAFENLEEQQENAIQRLKEKY